MKLQKLMYLTCGWHSAREGVWIIGGDFYAYPYGPVEKEALAFFRPYGSRPITSPMYEDYIINRKTHPTIFETLEFVFKEYGNLDDLALSDITHQPGTPWYEKFMEIPKGKIERGTIWNHFKELKKKQDLS